MAELPHGLATHRVRAADVASVVHGDVRWSPVKSLWFSGMAATAIIGGPLLFSWSALLLFVSTTGIVLLLGHSLGSHRKLIHDSFQCPRWLERLLVYLGVQVGLAGPIGLLRQHELRDYAQRLPDCHPFLRHGRSFWVDAWWQLNCELRLANPPQIHIEERIASDRFYVLLERTWMLQQLPVALLLYAWGGWGFVVFGVCARVTAGVFGHWLIGYFAHNHGPVHHTVRGAAIQGHNVPWTSLLTMGECWHNNHHAFPGSARLGLHRGEWDPGWWVLQALAKCGLVWSLRLPADLPFRPELSAAGDVQPTGVHLGEAWHLLMRTAETAPMALEWPGKRLGTDRMRNMLGPGVTITLNRSAPRLTLSTPDGRSMVGLPAICVAAFQSRSLASRLVGTVFLPLAVALEGVRGTPQQC
jgi:stearoyl-CoA desaturase (delta-9 desaturase)